MKTKTSKYKLDSLRLWEHITMKADYRNAYFAIRRYEQKNPDREFEIIKFSETEILIRRIR